MFVNKNNGLSVSHQVSDLEKEVSQNYVRLSSRTSVWLVSGRNKRLTSNRAAILGEEISFDKCCELDVPSRNPNHFVMQEEY